MGWLVVAFKPEEQTLHVGEKVFTFTLNRNTVCMRTDDLIVNNIRRPYHGELAVPLYRNKDMTLRLTGSARGRYISVAIDAPRSLVIRKARK